MWAFNETDIFNKIKILRSSADLALTNKVKIDVPVEPARDIAVLEFKLHPPKKGFSSPEGQARMLHDLANIELQAMELGLRTLAEFPNSPQSFKEELWAITISESQHLEMCLQEIEALGYKWGDWPANSGLWRSVSPGDTLIDRVLIVHRYLEGSGLDSGDTLLKRLAGVDASSVKKAVKIINTEEVGHVEFGSRWYFELCRSEKIDPNADFEIRMNRLKDVLPKRVSPINKELRLKAGFTESEISYLENLRDFYLISPKSSKSKN